MNIGLALKLLGRDWRSGELTLLLVSLIIAVGTVTTITLFVDRLSQALLRESATFLAADRVIASSDVISPEILQQADELGLKRAETLEFLSMAFSDDRAQFVSVKAVSEAYPLRGKLIASDVPFINGSVSEQGPAAGQVWLESRLMPSLDVQIGDVIDIGVSGLVVGKVLIKEPDRGGGLNSAGPRVMMNLADVPATKVVQPASRVTYRYLFAGDAAQLTALTTWVVPKMTDNMRLIGIKDGAEGIGSALDRAERFLLLGGLLGVVLAGIAIALAAHRYALRHYDHVAVLKTLGASPGTIDGIFLTIFLALGALATVFGTALGYLVQMGIVEILRPYIPIELPRPGLRPVWIGMVTGIVCLLAYALPPLMRLRATEPIRVMRRDLVETTVSDRITYGAAVVGTIALMWWYSEDLKLTLLLFSGTVVAAVILGSVAWGLLHSGRMLGMQAGSAWRLALAGMHRRGPENTLQILVFGLAIMLLLIVILVRTALIDEWRSQIPEDAPNHFALNISPQDVEPIRALFAAREIKSQPLYPMIQGRVTAIDGEATKVRESRQRNWDEKRDGERGPNASSSRNLTQTATLPDDNRVQSGAWWPADYSGPALVSIEESMASRNDIVVGDELVLDIQGRSLTATVASIRGVAWDNMQPNFYLILSPGALDDFPSTYMTSFTLHRDNKLFLNELLRQFPTMTVVEVDALIEQIQTIITQVTLAIELILCLIIVSGGLVLMASIQASMDERLQQQAILRTLGASRRLVMGSLLIEFCALGFFAGILATVGSEVTVYGLEEKVFQLDYSMNPMLWVLGPLIGTVMIGLVGTLATMKVVNTPPITVLRGL